jgi:transposase-like protein
MTAESAIWTAHVAAVKQGSISARAYAQQHDISLASLYYWKRKLKDASANPEVAPMPVSKFVALRLPATTLAPRATSCTLILASGLRLEMPALPAPEWLAAVGRALQDAR